MPDFNRLHMVNSLCPNVSHDHRRANAAEIDIINKLNRKHLFGEESYCAICSVHYNNTLKLGWKCPNYRDVKIIELSNKQRETLTHIFNNDPVFYLPDLVHEKIFNYASVHYIETIDNINRNTINHLFNCNLCAEKTLRWINYNCCVKHQLPRPKEKKGELFYTRFR